MPDLTADTRQRILSAAARIFAEKGFHAARMEEIAQAAAIGKSTVYDYYASKQDLFAQMFQAGCQLYLDELQAVIRPGMTVKEKLESVVLLHLRFILRHQNISRVLLQECFQIDTAMKEQLMAVQQFRRELVTGILQAGISQGILRSLDCSLTARLLLGAVNDLGIPPAVSLEGRSPELLAADIVDVFLHGLRLGAAVSAADPVPDN